MSGDNRADFDGTRVQQPSTTLGSPDQLAGPGDLTRAQPVSTVASIGPPNETVAIQTTVACGRTLRGRFVLEELIASGGMGSVFKARDLFKEQAQDRNPHVAIKVIHDDLRDNPSALTALEREASRTQRLSHTNIIHVFDFDRDGDVVFMTMELLAGESLNQVMKRHKGRPLELQFVNHIISGVGQALAHAHRQRVVHSDIKPNNIFLTQDNVVKVLDFGIARMLAAHESDKTLFDAAVQLGAYTPAYVSCEVIEGAEPDPRDDIYALAVVAYELLAGRHPFGRMLATDARDGGIAPKPIPGLTRGQLRALSRGLAFARADRTQTVDEFLADFLDRNRRTILLPLVAGAICVAGVIVGVQHQRSSTEDQIIFETGNLMRALAGGQDPAGLIGQAINVKQIFDGSWLPPGAPSRMGAEAASRLAVELGLRAIKAGSLREASRYLEIVRALVSIPDVDAGPQWAELQSQVLAMNHPVERESAAPGKDAVEGGGLGDWIHSAIAGLQPLEIRLNRPFYVSGQDVDVSVNVPEAGYLHLMYLGPDQDLLLLFPNNVIRENRVQPGLWQIPKKVLRLKALPPFGRSSMIAVVSVEPRNLYRMRAQGTATERGQRLDLLKLDRSALSALWGDPPEGSITHANIAEFWICRDQADAHCHPEN